MKKIAITLATLALTTGLSVPVYAQGAAEHQITMQQADIRAFINNVSMVTGKTFLVDPRVQGNVTISSEEKLTPKEVFEVFKNVMRVHGYTVIRTPTGEYSVTLMQGAAQSAPFVSGTGYNGQFATTVIKLQHADSADAAKLIKPVMHSQGILTANAGGNILVITDFPENLYKARQIVAAMDTNGLVTESVNFQYITAVDAQDTLKALGGARPAFRAIAVPGTNSLILEGSPSEVRRLLPILQQMDNPNNLTPRGAVSVLPLRYANGEELNEVIQNLLPSYTREGQPAPSVVYERGSNSIVISASGETQQALEQIIRRLDVRRPQVTVEALIVEISDSAASELGVQWALGGVDGSSIPFIGTNFSRQAPNLLTLAGALAGPRLGVDTSGLETAAVNSLVGIDGIGVGGAGISGNTLFSVILNAIENDDDSNILSTPFVTTLDNEEASFIVGQQIPITTGESLGSDNLNPFRTFERIDVGIKLTVLPQISEGDVVRMKITSEVSSIAGAITSIANDFITNKREIDTTVLANDGEIIVLGGLIQDDEQLNISKVPILGDLPVVGNAFRSKGKSHIKTNLMVFLRPTIIRSQADSEPLTRRRLDQMRREDLLQSGREYSKIDEFVNPR